MPLIVEYVWCSGKDLHHDIRSKSRTLWIPEAEYFELQKRQLTHAQPQLKWVERLPTWNFDGSSTNQAVGLNTEIFIRPVRVFYNPMFHREHVASLITLCECFFSN